MPSMHASSTKIWCLLSCACLLVPAVVGERAAARRLVNQEYGFSLEIPVGAIGCPEVHGFSILLPPSTGSCESPLTQAHVGLFGDFNAAFHTTPPEALKGLCPNGPVQAAKSELRLTFPGRASAVCRRDRADGWVDIYVVAQAGSWPKGFNLDHSVPYIDYTAQLHARASELTGDLKMFRLVLASIRIEGVPDGSPEPRQSAPSPR